MALVDTVDAVQPKIVKIYGAGGYRGMESYQSGMLISPEGHILTAYSYVLDTESITVVLSDGRRYEAKLLGADPRLEVAVLKIEAKGLHAFDLQRVMKAEAGTGVLAFSNLFGVAAGNEYASVQRGTISVIARLDARRGAFDTPYHGPVYVLDVTTNNPGAAGGALVSRRGDLLGMLGKELRNAQNNTWLNYAIPIAELQGAIDEIKAGKLSSRRDMQAKKPQRPLDLAALGVVLVPDILARTPPYVDSVRAGSPAEKAGLRPDDLIVFCGDHLVQSCKALLAELEYIDYEDSVRLTIQRGLDLQELELRPNHRGAPEK